VWPSSAGSFESNYDNAEHFSSAPLCVVLRLVFDNAIRVRATIALRGRLCI
jgi:hypothetical protein